MDIIGYFVTLASLQNLSRVGTPLIDSSVHVGPLHELAIELYNIPDFPLEGYRENGFQKRGNMAVYASKDLRNFIFEGVGTGDDEGVIVKLYYGVSQTGHSDVDTVTYNIQGDVVHVDVQEKNSEDLDEDNVYRKKRSLVEKNISTS